MNGIPDRVRLFGGVVAYNEEARIESAVRSLVDQSLPEWVAWSAICVLASGCTDRTVEVLHAAFDAEPLVEVVSEPVRHGKAAALNRLFERATGDWFILLDGDCEAEPGAIEALLEAASPSGSAPVAVGARHVPPDIGGAFGGAVTLLWAIAHQRALGAPPGENARVLLDNLALLPIGSLTPIPPGTINESGWLETHLLAHGTTVRYAPGARVAISVPDGFAGYVAQRRRIVSGHRQMARRSGAPGSTLSSEFLRHPLRSGVAVLGEARRRRIGWVSVTGLLAAEAAAHLLSLLTTDARLGELAVWPRIPAACAPPRRELGGGPARLPRTE